MIGMIDNAQYLTIFKLMPNDIKELGLLLGSVGGLTPNEQEFLSITNIGECIFAPYSKLRIQVKVSRSETETLITKEILTNSQIKEIFFPTKETKLTLPKIDLVNIKKLE